MTPSSRAASPAPPNAPSDPAARHPREVLAVLLLACVSFALAQTLVIPALPEISRQFDAGPAATSWVLTGFLLSASVATPIVGKLGDLFGRGRVLTWVLVIFALGGVVNALAGSIEVLVLGRILQGVAGGVFPLAFGIVRDTSPRERVPTDLAVLSAVFGIGGGIGLPLSGVIVDNFDIAWLFWISLVALPAALAAHRLIPSAPSQNRTKVDWPGAVLLSLALGATLLGVTQAESWGWGSPRTLALVIGGPLLALVWVRVEGMVEQPLIELSLLRERAVAATNLTALLVGLGMFSSFLLIPQFAQTPEATGYGSVQRDRVRAAAGAVRAESAAGRPVRRAARGADRVPPGARDGCAAQQSRPSSCWRSRTPGRGSSWWPGCCSASASASPSRRWPTWWWPRRRSSRWASRPASTP